MSEYVYNVCNRNNWSFDIKYVLLRQKTTSIIYKIQILMKKFCFSVLMLIASMSVLNASGVSVGDEVEYPTIDLQYRHSDIRVDIPLTRPRIPVNPPKVYQNNYNIVFEICGFCSSISIVDCETEDIVYDTLVSDSETQVTLPQFLEGEYEIRFNRDSYYYFGIIQL